MFNLLTSFVTSFVTARDRSPRCCAGGPRVGPFRNLTVGRRHIHHFVPGIVLAFVSGAAAIVTRDEDLERWLAIPFGAGMGLTLDESALLLELDDVYWSEEGIVSVQIALGGHRAAGRRGAGHALPAPRRAGGARAPEPVGAVGSIRVAADGIRPRPQSPGRRLRPGRPAGSAAPEGRSSRTGRPQSPAPAARSPRAPSSRRPAGAGASSPPAAGAGVRRLPPAPRATGARCRPAAGSSRCAAARLPAAGPARQLGQSRRRPTLIDGAHPLVPS